MREVRFIDQFDELHSRALNLDKEWLANLVANSGWHLADEPANIRADLGIFPSVAVATEWVQHRAQADLGTRPYFWIAPLPGSEGANRIYMDWHPSFPAEPFDHGWGDQAYNWHYIDNFLEEWLAVVSAKLRLRVFISYARDDELQADNLCSHLEDEGHDVWLDTRKLVAGQDWASQIRRSIKHSDAVILFMSKRSISKVGFVQKEMRLALDAAEERPDSSIFLIPIRLDSTPLPDRLARLHSIDARVGNWRDQLRMSLEHVRWPDTDTLTSDGGRS